MNDGQNAAGTLAEDFVTFSLGREILAVPTNLVREILEPGDITRVPGASEFVGSLLNVRGAVVPLADLRVPLRMPREPLSSSQRVLVIELPLETQICVIGILADHVHEVTGLDAGKIEPIPPVGSRCPPRLVTAVGRIGETFVTIPDLATIFADFLTIPSPPMEKAGVSGRFTEAEA